MAKYQTTMLSVGARTGSGHLIGCRPLSRRARGTLGARSRMQALVRWTDRRADKPGSQTLKLPKLPEMPTLQTRRTGWVASRAVTGDVRAMSCLEYGRRGSGERGKCSRFKIRPPGALDVPTGRVPAIARWLCQLSRHWTSGRSCDGCRENPAAGAGDITCPGAADAVPDIPA